MTRDEALDLAGYGAHPVAWRLAMHPDERVRISLADLRTMPCPLIWQAEIVADVADRERKRAELEAAHNRAHAAAIRSIHGGS